MVQNTGRMKEVCILWFMHIWSFLAYRQKDFSNTVHGKLYPPPFFFNFLSLTWVIRVLEASMHEMQLWCWNYMELQIAVERTLFLWVEQPKAGIWGLQLKTEGAISERRCVDTQRRELSVLYESASWMLACQSPVDLCLSEWSRECLKGAKGIQQPEKWRRQGNKNEQLVKQPLKEKDILITKIIRDT